MKNVRLGIVGVGGMGSAHARQIIAGNIPRLQLAAIADTDPEALAKFPEIKGYPSAKALIASGDVDAVLVATPHYGHTTVGIQALEAGLHLLVEKPISVHKADAQRLIAAFKSKKQVFSAMFNQRTDPFFKKIRDLVKSGQLGKIQRVQWTITNWFRPDIYYASGSWRATWGGEGGGVLLNQCPHNIDLFQWMFGMPKRVRAYCKFGRYHDIEVEDEVTAYMEWADESSAVFITTTGEAPGTNRLEVAADWGRLVYENDQLRFTRNEVPTREFSKTTQHMFGSPGTWDIQIPLHGHGGQHNEILKNFTGAILDGTPLIAPAPEGINSVELANAMILSSIKDKTIELPLDAKGYERELKKLIAASKGRKKVVKKPVSSDLGQSFSK